MSDSEKKENESEDLPILFDNPPESEPDISDFCEININEKSGEDQDESEQTTSESSKEKGSSIFSEFYNIVSLDGSWIDQGRIKFSQLKKKLEDDPSNKTEEEKESTSDQRDLPSDSNIPDISQLKLIDLCNQLIERDKKIYEYEISLKEISNKYSILEQKFSDDNSLKIETGNNSEKEVNPMTMPGEVGDTIKDQNEEVKNEIEEKSDIDSITQQTDSDQSSENGNGSSSNKIIITQVVKLTQSSGSDEDEAFIRVDCPSKKLKNKSEEKLQDERISDLINKCEQLQIQLDSKSNQYKSLEEEKDNLLKDIDLVNKERCDDLQLIKKSNCELERLREQIIAKEEESEEISNLLEETRENLSTVEKELQGSNFENTKLVDLNKELNLDAEQLKVTLKELKQQQQQKNDEEKVLKNQDNLLETLEKEVQTEEIEEEKSTEFDKLNKEIDLKNENIEILNKKISEYEILLNSNESELTEIKNQQDEIINGYQKIQEVYEDLQKENNHFQDELLRKNSELEILLGEKENMIQISQKMEEISTLYIEKEKNLNFLSCQNEELNVKLIKLTEELNQALCLNKGKGEEIANLNCQKDQLVASLNQKNNNIEQLVKNVSELQDSLDKKVGELTNTVMEKDEEITKAIQQFDEYFNENQIKVNFLEAELEKKKQSYEDSFLRENKLIKERDDCVEELKEKALLVKSNEIQLKKLSDENKQKMNALSESMAQCNNLFEEVSQSNQQIAKVHNELQNEKVTNDLLRQSLRTAEMEKDNLRKQIEKEFQNKFDKLKKDYENKSAIIREEFDKRNLEELITFRSALEKAEVELEGVKNRTVIGDLDVKNSKEILMKDLEEFKRKLIFAENEKDSLEKKVQLLHEKLLEIETSEIKCFEESLMLKEWTRQLELDCIKYREQLEGSNFKGGNLLDSNLKTKALHDKVLNLSQSLQDRDKRSEELTLEISRLLEERDILQVKLSNLLKENLILEKTKDEKYEESENENELIIKMKELERHNFSLSLDLRRERDIRRIIQEQLFFSQSSKFNQKVYSQSQDTSSISGQHNPKIFQKLERVTSNPSSVVEII